MHLEDYFDFLESGAIRLKGRRIGLEHIIERYKAGASPEQIAEYFGDLSLEHVYAAITYYLHNQAEIDAYLGRLTDAVDEQVRAARAHPSPVAQRIMAVKRRREQEQPVS